MPADNSDNHTHSDSELEKYNYFLPNEFIAQSPAVPRDHSKLLIAVKQKNQAKQDKSERIQTIHTQFFNLIDYLNSGDVLVINETKVSQARLTGKKDTGGRVEVILEKKLAKSNQWQCRIKGNKVREGTGLVFEKARGEVLEKSEDKFAVRFEDLKKERSTMPLPPYIKNKVRERDYQTVYANVRQQGSLAAPTAGLHFTTELLEKIKQKGVRIAKVCLHISFSTFLPVRNIQSHKTGLEEYEITKENAGIINKAIKNDKAGNRGRLIAVGTTTLKTLETVAHKHGKIVPDKGCSDLFIKPGFEFKSGVDAMITNFHLPKSSLLLLVSAFFGRENILNLYQQAIKKNYRFYSLGDAMFLVNENKHPQ